MRKPTTYDQTSYHNVQIRTTINKLKALADKIGAEYFEPDHINEKSQFDFEFETESGVFFTVYDWKEYRELNHNEVLSFHIGSENEIGSIEAKQELTKAL